MDSLPAVAFSSNTGESPMTLCWALFIAALLPVATETDTAESLSDNVDATSGLMVTVPTSPEMETLAPESVTAVNASASSVASALSGV